MSGWTKTGGIVLIGLAASMLCANSVPTSPEALTKRADLVADVTVTRLGIHSPLPGGGSTTCLHAKVDRFLKGVGEPRLVVCESGIAEFQPPEPELGQRYRMYLMRETPGIYAPFSFAGFRKLGEDASNSAARDTR